PSTSRPLRLARTRTRLCRDGARANHPAVVRYWRNVKKLARSQLKYASTVEGHRRRAGQHQANMFNITPGCDNAWPDVLAPLPTRLVCGATNGHTAEMY